jgi:TRAP-type C4-dicarboxylate transport system permease large subunit
MLGLSSNPTVVFMLILFMLFVAGLFIESTVLVLLLTPIFVPIITHIGVDPVHFGVLMMIIVTLGSMTPPVGVAMYTVCSLLDTDVGDYVKESVPFVAAVLALVVALIFFPDLVLFVPRAFF